MIQVTTASLQFDNWQQAMARSISDPAALLRYLELPDSLLPSAQKATKLFGLKVTHAYLDRINASDPADPLLRQVLPLDAELEQTSDYSSDPVGDHEAIRTPGLLQKYNGRALLLTTGACGIHCRYCFRRHFDYASSNPASEDWQAAITTLTQDASITEVILSGGDPLSLTDNKLQHLISMLEDISHIKRLRIHTRLPVVLPERVTTMLSDILASSSLQIITVLHINHANEIDNHVETACERLRETGSWLLNQSVLLAGVNDNHESLCMLSERLSECGIQPYYLHQLDKVQGAAHFAVDDEKARQLVNQIRATLPGYLVPRLVREQAGAHSKSPL